jgi:hypothetical protein
LAKQIIVTQNDYGIELETQFVDDKKKPLDITDYDVRVKIIYDDKTIDTILAGHKDSVNGIAYIVLEKEHLINAGLHTSVWSVVDEDEHVTAQENVYYFVKDVEGSEDDTPTTDLPIDADGVLNKFNEIDNNLFELTEQGNVVNEEIDSINETLSVVNEQLETKANTNKIVQIIGYEFLEMKGQDISDLLQYYVDNNYNIILPSNYSFICSKPVTINKRTVIKGNNSYIKFTFDGERGLFEQNNNGASLECYDLEVEIKNNQIAYDFRLENNESGTHLRLYNCVINGNKNNTKGVLLKQNDFSCVKDTKFWSVSYPIEATTDARDNTQLLFENVGIVDCITGILLEQNDKVSLINVDIATCETGFKLLGRNKRIKFSNCHCESFTDTGFVIVDNVKNEDIIFENCSVLVPLEATKRGFYCGKNIEYFTTGLKFINCGGDLGGKRIFDINCSCEFKGNINVNDKFISFEDTYLNTRLIRNEEKIKYSTKEIATGDGTFSGTITFTQNDNFNNFNFNGEIYVNHTFDEVGFYEIQLNGYNSSQDEIFCYIQESGGEWGKLYDNIRLNKNKNIQKFIFYVSSPATYRIGFKSYASVDMKMRNIIISNV